VLTDIDQWLALKYNLAVNQGIFITEVAPGSPADQAGLTPQDVIVGFGGKETTNTGELIQAIHDSQIGQEITVTFWRGNNQMSTSVILAETPPPG